MSYRWMEESELCRSPEDQHEPDELVYPSLAQFGDGVTGPACRGLSAAHEIRFRATAGDGKLLLG